MYMFTKAFPYQRHTYEEMNFPTHLSPTLDQLKLFYLGNYGGANLGGYGRRPIRGSLTIPSTHGFGAAWDWRYANVGSGHAPLTREQALALIDWTIANFRAIGIQQIHDYFGCRIWKCERGWKDQEPSTVTGMGQNWAQYFHLEVHPDAWYDERLIEERDLLVAPLPPFKLNPNPPVPPVSTEVIVTVPMNVLAKGTTGKDVKKLQALLVTLFGAQLTINGVFDDPTTVAVKDAQGLLKITIDGQVGKQTWTAILNY